MGVTDISISGAKGKKLTTLEDWESETIFPTQMALACCWNPEFFGTGLFLVGAREFEHPFPECEARG